MRFLDRFQNPAANIRNLLENHLPRQSFLHQPRHEFAILLDHDVESAGPTARPVPAQSLSGTLRLCEWAKAQHKPAQGKLVPSAALGYRCSHMPRSGSHKSSRGWSEAKPTDQLIPRPSAA
jgi:hypothetical protein